MENCCQPNKHQPKGLWSGLVYGLIPHIFCISFFILSLLGATLGATIAKRFLLIPHFFLFLTLISFFFATLVAFLYLKKNNCCRISQIKEKKEISANPVCHYYHYQRPSRLYHHTDVGQPVRQTSQEHSHPVINSQYRRPNPLPGPCPAHNR